MAPVTRTLASATLLLLLLLLLSSLVFTFASRPVAQPAPQTASSDVGTHGLGTGMCFDLFQLLMQWSVGKPSTFHPCCAFICGMVDYEAAASLCYTFKSNFLGMKIDYHKSISMIMNYCGLTVPRYFKC